MAGEVPSSAFVGRAVELHRLDAVLERAGQGSPQVALVAGDAGVGKTRLLLALADRARRRGMRVLMGASVELGDIGLPYLPVVDALRELADDPEEAGLLTGAAMTAPVLGRLLPGIEPAGLTGGDPDQLQVLDAIRAVLVGLAERSPVVLVLEDLHWADRATRDLLAFLVRTLRGGRVALVASYRSDELHRRHPLRPLLAELVRLPAVERLELAPFTRAELDEHLEAVAGAPLSPDRLEDILARSEGNPFYAEQLLAAGAADARVELPATLAEVLLARVQGLSEPAQRVLRVAAVVGRRVPHRLLAGVAGQPEAELEEGLQEAVSARVLTADATTGSYAFRHALLQEAVYGDLLPGEQVRLHAACARLLAAETADPERAARAYERLGLYLYAAGRVEEALAARAQAVELVPARPPTRLRARVTAAVAMALIDAARPAEARRWCDEALAAARDAGSADEEADVLITQGVIEQYDDPAKACSLFAAARAQAAGVGNPEIELRALYDLAEVSNQLGDLATACAAADEGIEVADRTGLGWSTIVILLRRAQLKAHYRNGDWEECERLLAAVPGLTTLAVAQVVAQGLGVLVARARPDAPLRLRQLVGLAGADPVLDRDVAVWEAELAGWQGDLDRARSAIRRGLATADQVEIFDQALEGAWVAMNGLSVEADRAEQARAADDTATLADATAAGRALLGRVRPTPSRRRGPPWPMTCTSAAGGPRRRPSGPGWRVAPTRHAGRPPSRPSPTATSTPWPAASGGWRRRWPPSATGSGRPRPPGRRTRPRPGSGRGRCGRPWRRWPAGVASTSAPACRRSSGWPA